MQKKAKYGMNLSIAHLLYINTSKDISLKDYYPGGMVMPERSFSYANYRFGFNDKEDDSDVQASGNIQDYGMRIYDPRRGQFISVDPISKSFPWYSPYQFAGNKPIVAIDIDGLEDKWVTYYQRFDQQGKLKVSNKNATRHFGLNTHHGYYGLEFDGWQPLGERGWGVQYQMEVEQEQFDGSVLNKQFTVFVPRNLSGIPQVQIFGSSSGESSPGSKADPNKEITTFDFDEFLKIMDPIMTGLGIEEPNFSDLSFEDQAVKLSELSKEVYDIKSEERSVYCKTCKKAFFIENGIPSYKESEIPASDTINKHE